ncbi:MAG: universal stress protein [Pirellulales bacterium]
MSKSLLLALKPDPHQESLVAYAVALARRQGLAVDARSVIDLRRLAPAEAVPMGAAAYKADRDELRLAEARRHAAELIQQVAATAALQQVECQAEVREGDTVEVLAGAVRRCDFLLCGHTPGGDASERSLLYAFLRQSARPALIVPRGAVADGGSTLVAYDGSAQAARALASFVHSGLGVGRPVHVTTFSDDLERASDELREAEVFLTRHGLACTATVQPLVASPLQLILEEAQRVAARLLVMGSFGRSVVQEFFLGSVTRSILEQLPLPVFLDH